MKRNVGNEDLDFEDNEDNDTSEDNSSQKEQNSKDSESLETPPIIKRGRQKKSFRANENKKESSSSVKKRHGRPRKDSLHGNIKG